MITAKNVGFETEGHQVFSGVNFSISKGDKVGLVGPNGAGKTTLLHLFAGDFDPTEGSIIREDVEVGFLPQDLRPWLDCTVYGFIEQATGVTTVKEAYYRALSEYHVDQNGQEALIKLCDTAARLGHYGVDSFEKTVATSLTEAGLDEDFASREVGELSGGQRTRVALAAIISAPYDVILLDEPTNNLDAAGINILDNFIKRSKAAFLMVSHDRRFLRSTTSQIIELLGGGAGVNQYGLGYDEYVEARRLAYESEERRYTGHRAAIKGLESRARLQKNRASSAERGGSRRTDGDKLTANHRAGRAAGHLASQARGLETRLERMREETPNKPQKPISLDFMFPETDIVGSQNLLTVNDLVVTYADQARRFGPYNLTVSIGDRVAITGANGAGKSTLIRAIMGDIDTESGQSSFGKNTRVAYIDQSQTLPLPYQTPLDNLLALAPEITREEAMHLLVKFNLKRDSLNSVKVENLSGGERAKILLASITARKANLLILDEPTNNLDIPTIEGLQEALASYRGAVVLVSHDRDFIEGIGVNTTIEVK